MSVPRFLTACALSSAALTAQLGGAPVATGQWTDPVIEWNVTSEVLPGVERSFASFSAAADEATQSRIFAGVHFRNDLTSGHRLGRDVADFVLDHFLTRRHRHDEDEVR